MKKFALTGLNKVMAILLAILAVLLIIVTTLDRFGLRLVYPMLPLLGCVLLIWLLLGWGAVALFRKMKNATLRMVVGIVLGLFVAVVGMSMLTYVMQLSMIIFPSKYAVISSPEGQKVVIMQAVDTGAGSEEDYEAMVKRMNVRRDAINAATPAPEDSTASETTPAPENSIVPDVTPAPQESSTPDSASASEEVEGEYPRGAFGYVYTPYPSVLGIFYRPGAEVEGAVNRGCESEAKILYEWTDANTVRIYIENAEPGDEGEAVLCG